MKNRGSTPILTNLVGGHPRNIHTKFEANPCSGSREEIKKVTQNYPKSHSTRGSTQILTNLVGVHTRNIHTKFESNL